MVSRRSRTSAAPEVADVDENEKAPVDDTRKPGLASFPSAEAAGFPAIVAEKWMFPPASKLMVADVEYPLVRVILWSVIVVGPNVNVLPSPLNVSAFANAFCAEPLDPAGAT